MPIRVICPSCSRIGKAPDQAVGRTVRCPACKHSYVVTADLVRPDDGYDLDPAPEPTAPRADDTYGLDPAVIQPPKRPAPRPPVAPSPAVEETPDREGGFALPVPALVGGGIGVVSPRRRGGVGPRPVRGPRPVAEAPNAGSRGTGPPARPSLKEAAEGPARPSPPRPR